MFIFLHPLPYYKQYSIQYTILCCPYAASQADTDPTSDLGTNFDGLDAREKRDEVVKDKQLDKPSMNKFVQDGSPVLYHLSGFISICLPWYILSRIILLEENTLIVTWHRPCKTKATLRTFLTSMMSKSGKLRSLVRDLKKTYCDSATSACLIQKKKKSKGSFFPQVFPPANLHPQHSHPGLIWLHKVHHDLAKPHCRGRQALWCLQRVMGKGWGRRFQHRKVAGTRMYVQKLQWQTLFWMSDVKLSCTRMHFVPNPRWYTDAEAKMKQATFASFT